MAGFNLDNYEPVEDRLTRFWADHPEGRVLTELMFNDGATFIFRAEIYFDREDTRPVSTGHATETVSTRGVNQTSALENCETSAVGRALADASYAPKGARASREEMNKAQRGQDQRNSNDRQQRDPVSQARGEAWAEAQKLGMTMEKFASDFRRVAGVTVEQGTAAQFQHYAAQLRESRNTAGAA